MLVAFRMIQKLVISGDRFVNKSYYRIGYIRYYNPVFYHNNRGNRKQLYGVCSFNWRREEPARFNGGERNGNWVIMHSWLRESSFANFRQFPIMGKIGSWENCLSRVTGSSVARTDQVSLLSFLL